MSERIPKDLALYLDALLVIESNEDARELLANPELFEDLDIHEMPESEGKESELES